jgi:hypothetical protein
MIQNPCLGDKERGLLNFFYEEIKSRLNSGNSCYYLVKNLPSLET